MKWVLYSYIVNQHKYLLSQTFAILFVTINIFLITLYLQTL